MNEHVEKMAAKLLETYWHDLKWSALKGRDEREEWRRLARAALAQHPAVDFVREFLKWADNAPVHMPRLQLEDAARSLLAALGKDGEDNERE